MKSGKMAGQPCINAAHHNGWCYKHKKTVVPQAIVDAVGVTSTAQPAKTKPKYSAFRFTINSNTNAASMSQEQVAEFKRMVHFVFDKENVVEFLKDSTNVDDSATNVDLVETAFFFEIAPSTHALHAHGVIKLKHHGHYSLDVDAIRAVCSQILGKKIHVHCQASGDPDRAWQDYIAKSQAAEAIV